jgi:hypothetical protein
MTKHQSGKGETGEKRQKAKAKSEAKDKSKAKPDEPYWQQNSSKKRSGANRFQSQPHSVGKRFWRI